MTDYTKEDIVINNKRGWERVCKKCRFVIPESEWSIFGECGQCGSKSFEKMKIKNNNKRLSKVNEVYG